MKIILAKTYGFCGGVRRAIEIAERARSQNPRGKIFVLKEIVHNPQVVAELARKQIKSAPSLKVIPSGATVVFSAHGVSPRVFAEAKKKGLKIVDATCPLVLKVHAIVRKLAKDGFRIIYLGDPLHDETLGVLGEVPARILSINPKLRRKDRLLVEKLKKKKPEKLAVITQTTLSLWDTEKAIGLFTDIFPQALIYNTICQATTERQKAVADLAEKVEALIVVGGRESANTKRLWEIAKNLKIAAHWVETARELKKKWFCQVNTVGVTAGASTPGRVIQEVIQKIKIAPGFKK